MVDSNINIFNENNKQFTNTIIEKEVNTFNSSIKSFEDINWNKKYCLKDFRIEQEIGRGAYANIYKANLINYNYDVAFTLKVINKELLEREKKLHHFYIEYNILKQLNHAFIAKVYTIFEESKKLIIVMDYYENGDLFDFVKYNSKLIN